MKIPTKVPQAQFDTYIQPRLSTAKRGYVSEQPLWKIFNYVLYKLHTGCQWEALPIERDTAGDPVMSWQVPRYHFYKWSRDGSLQRLFEEGILTIKDELDLSEINLDGSHTIAKKGAKVLPIRDESKQRPATFCRSLTGTGTLSASSGCQQVTIMTAMTSRRPSSASLATSNA